MQTIERVNVPESFEGYKTEAGHLQAVANGMAINNRDDAELASDMASRIQYALKRIDERRLEVTSEARRFVSHVGQYVGEITGPLSDAKQGLARKLTDWQAQERKRQDEIRREQERQRADALLSNQPAPVSTKEPEPVKVIQTRKVLKVDIIDAGAIPREFLVPDTRLIEQAGRARRDVPGVKFTWDEVPVVRSKA